MSITANSCTNSGWSWSRWCLPTSYFQQLLWAFDAGGPGETKSFARMRVGFLGISDPGPASQPASQAASREAGPSVRKVSIRQAYLQRR